MARTKRLSHSNIIRPQSGLIYGEYLTLVLDVTGEDTSSANIRHTLRVRRTGASIPDNSSDSLQRAQCSPPNTSAFGQVVHEGSRSLTPYNGLGTEPRIGLRPRRKSARSARAPPISDTYKSPPCRSYTWSRARGTCG